MQKLLQKQSTKKKDEEKVKQKLKDAKLSILLHRKSLLRLSAHTYAIIVM